MVRRTPPRAHIIDAAWALIQADISDVYFIQEGRLHRGYLYVPEEETVPAHVLNEHSEVIVRTKSQYSSMKQLTPDELYKWENPEELSWSDLQPSDISDADISAEDIIEDIEDE